MAPIPPERGEGVPGGWGSQAGIAIYLWRILPWKKIMQKSEGQTLTTEALTAGRELDQMVAKAVMGLRFDDHLMLQPSDHPWTAPRYSTDIAAAWAVLEEFDTWKVHRYPIGGDEIGVEAEVTRWRPEAFAYARARTAPEAICLAALKALQ